jgi:hypothetical protein
VDIYRQDTCVVFRAKNCMITHFILLSAVWQICWPPVLLHIIPLDDLSATTTLAHYVTGRSISHQNSFTLCHWAIYQPPVLLHFMPLDDLSAASTLALYATGQSIRYHFKDMFPSFPRHFNNNHIIAQHDTFIR